MTEVLQHEPSLPGISIVPAPPEFQSEWWPTAVPVWVGWYESFDDSKVVWQGVTSWEDYEACEAKGSPRWQGVREAVRLYFLNGGLRGYVMLLPHSELDHDWAQWLKASLGDEHAWGEALCEEYVSVITLPLLSECLESKEGALASGGPTELQPQVTPDEVAQHYVAVWQLVLKVTLARPDWFFVLDAPRDIDVANCCLKRLRATGGLGARGEHASMYGPHLVIDKDGHEALAAPSGAICGVMARVDAAEGIWKAPANEPVLGVLRPAYPEYQLRKWIDSEPFSINVIRSCPGRGVRVWGCRTLASNPDSSYRYVQIRRAATWIEVHLRAICQFAVFEPNELLTWLRLRTACEAWLRRLWEAGG
ncbi:phage tail sheath subtilisin-like domain-containing protein [Burkholderia ambifaria]|uniref:Phage tail sheath protein FI-like protein n=1 Tax=Burkholderia ambifaria MEX-5 TaxID=396597 RepID=B1T4F4_9BURK|nr:phage tail sheath subtilisin-like domain-containing protein [Burkholderia ambifaria]EDT41552.1 Phage tail sheath protein FI-like protein [Burkholderia ambifaria MEX-5]